MALTFKGSLILMILTLFCYIKELHIIILYAKQHVLQLESMKYMYIYKNMDMDQSKCLMFLE